ncbi:unnamed protein product [Vicia faba]|uniref:Uncharacterized protein n=1 Tax=Vicia faba TaxID=3906 RepID=A0AAV1BCB3_VICFA|nr:unnamed protein product [Vicia faba]
MKATWHARNQTRFQNIVLLWKSSCNSIISSSSLADNKCNHSPNSSITEFVILKKTLLFKFILPSPRFRKRFCGVSFILVGSKSISTGLPEVFRSELLVVEFLGIILVSI